MKSRLLENWSDADKPADETGYPYFQTNAWKTVEI